MNLGKKFEQNFKDSIPCELNNVLFYRFKDGTANWSGGKNENVRFQAKNVSDCMIYYTNTMNNISHLYIIELKSHKGSSLPLGCIRDNQMEEMINFSYKNNVSCLLVVFFSDKGRCFACDIRNIKEYISNTTKKSIPIDFFDSKDNAIELEVNLLRTNYRFNIQKIFDEIK